MILNYWPDKFELEAVVVYCFNLKGDLALFEKPLSHKLYPGLHGTVAGKMKLGENKFSASTREIKEETGNIVKSRSVIYLGKSFPTCHYEHRTGKEIIFLAHMMLCLQPLNKIILSKEHLRHHWVSIFDLLAEKFNCIPDVIDNLVECIPLIKKYRSIST